MLVAEAVLDVALVVVLAELVDDVLEVVLEASVDVELDAVVDVVDSSCRRSNNGKCMIPDVYDTSCNLVEYKMRFQSMSYHTDGFKYSKLY